MKKFSNNLSVLLSIFYNNKILKRPNFSEKNLFLQGQLMAETINKKEKINSLKDVEFSVFSQFGEDGIIHWIINRIPKIEKIFLEIGTQDYWESNTRFLLKLRDWKGYIFEGSAVDIKKIKLQRIYWQHKIQAFRIFVNKENINNLIGSHLKEKNIGLMSIDIDGNDYWILEKINNLSPSIIVCEFNSIFGDKFKLSVPYEKDFFRNKKHYSNLYFGSSIKALVSLLESKGYFFLGTGSRGVNAFFVKDYFKSLFVDNINEIKIFPSKARESLDQNGKMTYGNILDELNKIKNLEVFDFDENKIKKIHEYKELYSEEWKTLLR